MAFLECVIIFSGLPDCTGECGGYSLSCINQSLCWYFTMFGVKGRLGRYAVSTC